MALTQISTQGIKDGTITGSDLATNIDLVDNQKIRLGTSNDLEIFHSGSHSFINDNGTGNLQIRTNGTKVTLQGGTNAMLNAIKDGAVELYHNNVKKFETASNGVTLNDGLLLDNATNAGRDVQWQPTNDRLAFLDNTKATFGNGADLQIFHDGSQNIINGATGQNLEIQTNAFRVRNQADSESMIVANADSAVELYHDGSLKANTRSDGFEIKQHLTMGDSDEIRLGNSSDLKIYHDGTHSYIDNSTNNLYVNAPTFFQLGVSNGGEKYLTATENGAVELYHDNVKRIETNASGVVIPSGSNNCLRIFGTNNAHATSGLIISQNSSTDSQLRAYGPDSSTHGRIELRSSTSDSSDQKMIFYDAGNLEFPDNQKATFGDGDDLQIYHDGSHSFIRDSGTGTLRIETSQMNVIKADGSETMATFVQDAEVALFFDNSKKFETASYGVSTDGLMNFNGTGDKILIGDNGKVTFGGGSDLQIFSSGSIGHIKSANDDLRIETPRFNVLNQAATETMIDAYQNGAVELYHNNSKKLETTNSGALITGRLGIGESSPSNLLHLKGSGHDKVLVETTGTNHSVGIQMKHASGNAAEQVWQLQTHTGASTQKDLSVRDATSGTFVATFRKGGGITFNGDTAAANALDDFEEGSFTPSISSGTSAVSFNSRSGKYTKIGNLVTFTFHMNISSATLTSSALQFGGLPFTSVNNSNLTGGMSIMVSTGNISGSDTYRIVNNSTDVQVVTGAGDARAANATTINAGNRILSYFGFYYV